MKFTQLPAGFFILIMKRFFATILLMLYALSTVGLSAQMHLCGGEVYSVSVNSTQADDDCCCSDDTASCEDESSPSDCCTDTEVSAKVPDSHQITPLAVAPSTKISIAYISYIYAQYDYFHSLNKVSFSDPSHAPPDLQSLKSPLFLRLRILLI